MRTALAVLLASLGAFFLHTAPAEVDLPGVSVNATSLSSLALDPSTVEGGTPVKGVATLTSAAPSDGLVVSLSSSDPTVAAVPARITVGPGATSATFSVTTSLVTSSTSVRIKGTGGENTRAAALTVNPVGTEPLPAPSLISPEQDARFRPGLQVAFDWSDVDGAASYTLEIDDDKTFSMPLVLQQTTSASQFAAGTLPVSTLWWRARASDESGNAGAWSDVRSFAVED